MMSAHSQCDDNIFKEKHENNTEKKRWRHDPAETQVLHFRHTDNRAISRGKKT